MNAIDKLQELFKRFPGIGPRQAERFVYFLLHSNRAFKQEIARAILELEQETTKCTLCERFFLSNSGDDKCKICADSSREMDKLLIVEKETDIDKIERSEAYKGLYFISKGALSPLSDSSKHNSFISRIKSRINSGNFQEIILAFSATFDGEYTGKFIKEEIKSDASFAGIKVSFLGRGLSSGSEIEYADPETLRYALKNRFSN